MIHGFAYSSYMTFFKTVGINRRFCASLNQTGILVAMHIVFHEVRIEILEYCLDGLHRQRN